ERAKIVGRPHDAMTEEMMPKTIDHDARQQWIRRIHHSARQFGAATIHFKSTLNKSVHRFEKTTRHKFARGLRIAPDEDRFIESGSLDHRRNKSQFGKSCFHVTEFI